MVTDRVRALKERRRDSERLTRWRLYFFEGQKRAEPRMSRVINQAAAWEYLAENVPVEIDPGDLLAGCPLDAELTECEKALAEEHQKIQAAQLPEGRGGITGHMAIDNELLLQTGFKGRLETITEKEKLLDIGTPEGAKSRDFYIAARRSLNAAHRLSLRYADEAGRMADACDDPARAGELRAMAERCRRVPFEGARTFHEAVQSIWFMFLLNTITGGLMALGRLDQVLEGYSQKDLEAGIITPESAKEIIHAFYIKLNEITTSPESIIVGGVDAGGRPVENALTRLLLEAGGELRMVNPALGLAVNKHTSEEIMDLACRLVAGGYSHPAFYCDDTIISGLERIGIAAEHARRYINCTCTEMTPESNSGIWVVANYMNFANCLLRVLAGGAIADDDLPDAPCTGDPKEFSRFAQVMDALKKQLDYTVRENCMRMNRFAHVRKASGSFPLLSCFIHDCIETGQDLDEGGGRYMYFYPQLVGLATVTDSLVAIRRLVYEDKVLCLDEYRDALANDFSKRRKLRERIIHKLPKYGSNDPEADELARELFNHYVEQVEKYVNPYGARYHAGFLSWVMHARLGEVTGATPDGRHAGRALSDSFAAAQGQARRGATGVLESVEGFDLKKAVGAVVVNLMFEAGSLKGERGVKALGNLIRTHFSNGGFQVQINVVSHDDLERATKEPEKYEDLIVRVGGFSEYFVKLDPLIQQEIIQRQACDA